MSAREVERLGRELHELNERTIGDLGLAAVAFGLALAASRLHKDLAIPLFVGAMALVGLGMVAFVRRHLLVEDAAADPDAYLLGEVRRYGEHIASEDRRRACAAQIRRMLAANGDDPILEELADDLERRDLHFDPLCAVALDRLLLDGSIHSLPADELRSRLTQIVAGFGETGA
jgi:hypothetical protein